jgi:integrase
MSLDLERYTFRAEKIWPNTVDRRLQRLKDFQAFMKKSGFEEPDVHALDYYLDELMMTHDDPGTVRVYYYDVLSYFEAMLIPIDAMQLKRIQRRLPIVPTKEADWLTKEEVTKLFEVVSHNLKYTLIYHLCYEYARRTGEILPTGASPGLCVEDVTPSDITFYIVKKKEGLIPVTYALKNETERLINRWKKNPKRFGPWTERVDHLNEKMTVRPLIQLTQRAVEIQFPKHCARAGIKPNGGDQKNRRLVPHILRHSIITHMGQDDVPVDYVSKRLAQHSSVDVTTTSYRGFSKDEDRKRRGR